MAPSAFSAIVSSPAKASVCIQELDWQKGRGTAVIRAVLGDGVVVLVGLEDLALALLELGLPLELPQPPHLPGSDAPLRTAHGPVSKAHILSALRQEGS